MITLNHNFERWLEPCPQYGIRLRADKRNLVAYGGRGGSKSHAMAEIVLTLMRFRPGYRVLCLREFQNSLDESVYSLLQAKAEKLFPGFFEFKNGKVYGANGSFASFKGLARNLGSVKSLEGYNLCWIEEGQYISAVAWGLLSPTIRDLPNGDKPHIIITMNRDSEDAILDKVFIQAEELPPRSGVIKVNYYDNPYPIPELVAMAEHCKATDYQSYLHIWEGELNNISHAQVLHGKWRVARFETPKDAVFYHGADWSNGGTDPHTLIRSFVRGNKLYIDWELKTNVDFSELPALWRQCPSLSQGAPWIVYCDDARGDLIRYLCKHGFHAKAAPKNWQGTRSSIQAGIEYLRGMEIIIHEDCVETIKEATNWKWQLDPRTGDITAKLVPGNDHLMDPLRYSHYKAIMQSTTTVRGY